MSLALRKHSFLINIPIFVFVAISLLIFLPSSVKAVDDVVKAEMYMGDYEIRREKTPTGSFINKEVKYIETGSGKIIKERTSETNTWKMSYYHTNHQGSTSVVTANNGRVDTEYSRGRLRYFPYGEQITSHNINTQAVADTYTGQKRDTETNLMFYNARLYNQKTGLFMQSDSVNDGLNRYMYVSGNPTNMIDPTGNKSIEDDKRLGPEDREELLADRRRAEEAKRRRQAYVDKGVYEFARAFATWYGGDKNSQNYCEWTVGCDTEDFRGIAMSENRFDQADYIYNSARNLINNEANMHRELATGGEYNIPLLNSGEPIFTTDDFDRLNISQITDYNIAIFISLLTTEQPYEELMDSLYLNAHIGIGALQASMDIKPSEYPSYYSNDYRRYAVDRNLALIYSLRIYQGTYNSGGNFSALSDDRSNLNQDVFQYYNANPVWYPRANAIYQSLYNFASQNEEYSWLIENLVD